MARVNVKYPCGKKVCCQGVEGKITAVFIRGRGRTYEFSYVDKDGHPTSCNAEECELEVIDNKPIGFRSNRNDL